MTSQEEKVQRFLMGRKRKSEGVVSFGFKDSILGKTWYLDSWWEKAIFVLGFFALLWTILKLVVMGTL